MVNIIYEKDLRPMKYHVLTGPRQDRAVRAIAKWFNVRVQPMRKFLIERLDMSDMENMPARWEVAEAAPEADPLEAALGVRRFTKNIPLFTEEEMARALKAARAAASEGAGTDTTAKAGKDLLKEVIIG
jgi:energy-converting hydrogenase A subunit M